MMLLPGKKFCIMNLISKSFPLTSRTSSFQLNRNLTERSCFSFRLFSSMPATASDLIDFVHSTPTPFHLVTESVKKLEEAGFSRLDERELWAVNKKIVFGGKYFYHRNLSTIVAFTVGELYKPGGAFKVLTLPSTGYKQAMAVQSSTRGLCPNFVYIIYIINQQF